MYEITDGEEYDWTINYFPYRQIDPVNPGENEKHIPQLEQAIFTHFFPNLQGNKKEKTRLVGNLSMYEMMLENVEYVDSSTSEPFLMTSESFLRLCFRRPEPKLRDKLPPTYPVTFQNKNSPDNRKKSLFPPGYRELGQLNEALQNGEISQRIMLLGLEDGKGFGYTSHNNIENLQRKINDESQRYKNNPHEEHEFRKVNGSGFWRPVSWCVREGDLDEILTRVEK